VSHFPHAPLNLPERLGEQHAVVFKFYAFIRSQIFTKEKKKKKKKKTGLIMAGNFFFFLKKKKDSKYENG
jgi:hypothetical protein